MAIPETTVIDPKTDSVIATINCGGGLEFGDTGDNGKFYVDGAENNEIVRIDTATNKDDAHWPMPGYQAAWSCDRSRARSSVRELLEQGHGDHERRERRCDRNFPHRRRH